MFVALLLVTMPSTHLITAVRFMFAKLLSMLLTVDSHSPIRAGLVHAIHLDWRPSKREINTHYSNLQTRV